jgi:hypothetical protein
MNCLWQAHADLLIEPDVSAYAFDDFQKALGIVKVGYEAGLKMLPTFRAWAAEREAYSQYAYAHRKLSDNIAPSTTVVAHQPIALG